MKNENNIQQVADDGLECADSIDTEVENDRNQSVQNYEDKLKSSDKFRKYIQLGLKTLTDKRP